jgi:hypothetical protein
MELDISDTQIASVQDLLEMDTSVQQLVVEIVPWRPVLQAIALQLIPDIVEARRRATHQAKQI